MENIIQLRDVGKRYNDGTIALKKVNLDFKGGKIYGLLGPNGSGKSTMIKILTQMIRSFDGEVTVDGQSLGIHSKSIISYLPDNNFIDPNWKVSYILKFFDDFFEDFDKEKAETYIEKLSINENKPYRVLSKGTKEKLQLVLTLSRKAKIFIFDEPIAGVDPAAREVIFKLILSNKTPDSTIILCTHLISEAEDIIDEYIFLKKGKVVDFGNVEQAKQEQNKSLNEIFKEKFICLEDF